MRKNRRIVMPLLVFILVIGGWELYVRVFDISLYILPSPSKIISTLIENMDISNLDESRVSFDSCIFRNVTFDNCTFRYIDLLDVSFEKCDLSNIDFSEGSIYRTKRARANLTYLFTVSVKSEDTQVDMVTVRTVIQGLCR